MKKSRRYLLGTGATLLGLAIALIAVNRLLDDYAEPVSVTRTATGDLAAFRDFDRIEIRGDFRVEIVQQPEYSIDYVPLSAEQGSFTATQVEDLLVLRGGGNLIAGDSGLVRIGLPELYDVQISLSPEISISGFTIEQLQVELTEVGEAEILNNEVERFVLSAESVETVVMRGNSFGGQQLFIRRGTQLIVE